MRIAVVFCAVLALASGQLFPGPKRRNAIKQTIALTQVENKLSAFTQAVSDFFASRNECCEGLDNIVQYISENYFETVEFRWPNGTLRLAPNGQPRQFNSTAVLRSAFLPLRQFAFEFRNANLAAPSLVFTEGSQDVITATAYNPIQVRYKEQTGGFRPPAQLESVLLRTEWVKDMDGEWRVRKLTDTLQKISNWADGDSGEVYFNDPAFLTSCLVNGVPIDPNTDC
jgi:hypothetical protein